MISSKERGREYVEEQEQRGADDRGDEAVGGGAQGGGRGAGSGGIEAHHLCSESEVRRDGCKRSTRSEAAPGREHAVKETGGGSESGQGDAEGGDRKKRLELVDQRADVSWLRVGYVVSERRVCGLMGMAVSSTRYQRTDSDERLRTRL